MTTAQRVCVSFVLLIIAPASAFAQPGPATLVAPASDVVGSTIAFTWQSAPTATWYQFWLGKANTTLVMEQWYTAEHAGCVSGGTCTITVTPPIIAGGFIWHIRTWSSAGYGPWSPPHMFTMRDVMQAWTGKLPASRRYTLVFENAAVLDNETGLVWQRVPLTLSGQWPPTQSTCLLQQTGGRWGWRVPTAAELQSLLDPTVASNPKLPSNHPFQLSSGVEDRVFWTQTPLATNPTYHWAINVHTGGVTMHATTDDLRTWCVRGAAPSQ